MNRYIVGVFRSDVFDKMPETVQHKFIRDFLSKGENIIECKTRFEALQWCSSLNRTDGNHGYVYDKVEDKVTDIRVIN